MFGLEKECAMRDEMSKAKKEMGLMVVVMVGQYMRWV